MISRVQKRHVMKTSLSSIILLTLFALCAHGGEVEKFIRETLAEQRTRSALESNSAAEVIDDAVKGQNPFSQVQKRGIISPNARRRAHLCSKGEHKAWRMRIWTRSRPLSGPMKKM